MKNELTSDIRLYIILNRIKKNIENDEHGSALADVNRLIHKLNTKIEEDYFTYIKYINNDT